MLFNSWQYFVFLPLVVGLYFLLPQRFRWVLLLGASYYFYMSWNANLVVLIATTTLTSYAAALAIAKTDNARRRKLFLWLGVGISLVMLFFFKYFNFFSASVTAAIRVFRLPIDDVTLRVLLPVGISFYTFQTLSYVIDVYRGSLAAERHLGIYALYVSFFPQLVAGPIERAVNLLPQMREHHTANAANFSWGARMICIGMLKKVAIADFVAPMVTAVYSNVAGTNAMGHVLATLLFSVQVYCDFSGYSDIALGSARILGFRLMENFDAPYFARSVREFWRRWHISLSTWFSDYVYIPLGGSRTTKARHMRNLLLTFLLSGLWHGAAWTYVLWGLWHGTAQVVARCTAPARAKLRAALRIREDSALYHIWQTVFVFGVVCLSYILFRANSVQDAVFVFVRLPTVVLQPLVQLADAFTLMGITAPVAVRIVCSVLALGALDRLVYTKHAPCELIARSRPAVRAVVDYALIFTLLLAVLTMPEHVTAEFIYFQF